MAKLVVTKPTGERFEISDLSLADIKELAGLNGHNGHAQASESAHVETDYRKFFKALTTVGRKLIQVLQQNPQGIDANSLAKALGFTSTAQIGGLVGGGLGKTAPKYGVNPEDIYRRDVSSENGVRKVVYYPGKEIAQIKRKARLLAGFPWRGDRVGLL